MVSPSTENRHGQLPEHRIVLQKVGQGLGVGKVVYRDEFYIVPIETRADDIPANAAEAVNAYFD